MKPISLYSERSASRYNLPSYQGTILQKKLDQVPWVRLYAYFSLKYHLDEIILCMDTGAISMKIIIDEDFWRAQFHSSWSTLHTFEKNKLGQNTFIPV